MNRRVKSCGKDGQKAPLEIAGAISTFPQLQQELHDRKPLWKFFGAHNSLDTALTHR